MSAAWRLTEDDARQVRLIVWISEQSASIPSVAPFYGNDAALAKQARHDVFSLVDRGWVKPSIGGGMSLETVCAVVQPEGRSTAAEVQQLWRDRSRRKAACRTALVAWLYEVDAVETATRSVPWDGMLTSQHSAFYGDLFTTAEVDQASGWLHRHGLVGGITVAQFDGPVRVFLTDDGVKCAERYGSDANGYIEAMENKTGGMVTFNVNGQNVQVASGNNAQQVMHIGQTAEDIAKAMRGLTEVVRGIGLDEHEAKELEWLTEEAVADITSTTPSGAPAQRYLDRVRMLAGKVGTPALNTTVTLAVNALASDVTALVSALTG